MRADTSVRIANRNDIEGIVELQKHVYYEYNRDSQFFVWQCFENVNPSVLVVAQEGTSIVGTFGLQRIQTTGNLWGGQVSWIVIAGHKRGTGLFAKMGRHALEHMPDLNFTFIFANKTAVPPCEKTLGMKFVGSLSQLVSKDESLGTHAEFGLEPINHQTIFPNVPCSRKTITFARTEHYRRWRYANSTVYQYLKVTVPPGDYAIIKLFDKELSSQIGDIVDFECDTSDIGRLRHLFLAASSALRKLGATTITTWAVPGGELRTLLEEVGFSANDHCSFFGLNVLNEECNHIYDFGSWRLVQSDASNY
jgi:hypothetical protein